MSLPNQNVVNAIIESYLMSRSKWNLESQDGKVTLPGNDTETARKVDICLKILQKVNAGNLQTDQWIDIIRFLHEMELKETEALNNRNMFRKWIGSVRLLETIQAVRGYILESLQTMTVYVGRIQPLLDARIAAETRHTNYCAHTDIHNPEQIANAKTAMLAAYAVYKPYDLEALVLNKRDQHSYFAKYISVMVGSKEATFGDFEKNVVKKSLEKNDDNTVHKGKLCKKLLEQSLKAASETKATVVTNKPVIQEAPKAPAAQSKAPEVAVNKTSVVSAQPVVAQPTPLFFSPADFDFFSTPTAPAKHSTSTSSSSTKPVQAPIPEPRRSTRKHTQHQESKSSALRDNSSIKQPISTRSHDKSSKKGSDPYDWDDYQPSNRTSTRNRGY